MGKFSHLIGCIDINAIFYMFQGLVQVARTGSSEETIASICLQEEKRGRERRGIWGIRETHTHSRGVERKIKKETWLIFLYTNMKVCVRSFGVNNFLSVTPPFRLFLASAIQKSVSERKKVK